MPSADGTAAGMQAMPIETTQAPRPTLVAIDMGYGHFRPARALALALGSPVLEADRAPLADEQERRDWAAIRAGYERLSRISSLPIFGTLFRALLDGATSIPELYPFRDLSHRTVGVRLLELAAQRGLGRSLVAYLQQRGCSILTTFYSPAVFADYHGHDQIYCVVTDADINRVWAPFEPGQSRIHYFAPSGRVVRRLRAYGVPKDQVELTGYPLRHDLLGGPELPTLRANLRRRLVRLDPEGVFRREYAAELQSLELEETAQDPPRLVFAVGGAGAQAELPASFLPSLNPLLQRDRLRLTLVAGSRPEVRDLFHAQLERVNLGRETLGRVEVLFENTVHAYLDAFDALMARTDILWTKPSELTFYGGLGIALILAPPLGRHEVFNRQWARENGAALKQRDPRVAGEWLRDWLKDGTLAAAAWSGHKRLPCRGLYKICDRVGGVAQL